MVLHSLEKVLINLGKQFYVDEASCPGH